jgi:predicted RNA-binding protein associated with RNAse of E/G family
VHAPKVSVYDLKALTHEVKWGLCPVARFELGDGWLLMERPMIDHPDLLAMASYILPSLGIAVTRWTNRPQSTYAWYDYYVDILTCEVGETRWTTREFYLDVIVLENRAALTNDTDEYLEAVRAGYLTQAEAEDALTTMHRMLNGLGECGYSMRAWLRREVGLEMAF